MPPKRMSDQEFVLAWEDAYTSNTTLAEFCKNTGYAYQSAWGRRGTLIKKGHELPSLLNSVQKKKLLKGEVQLIPTIENKIIVQPSDAYISGVFDAIGKITFNSDDRFVVTVGLVTSSRELSKIIADRFSGLRSTPKENNSEVYVFSWKGDELISLVTTIAPYVIRLKTEVEALQKLINAMIELKEIEREILGRFKR